MNTTLWKLVYDELYREVLAIDNIRDFLKGA